MNKERHAYTVMVVPEREGKAAFSFRISRRRVIFLAFCAATAIIGMGVLIYKSVEAARKLSYFITLSRENDELKKQNTQLNLVHAKIAKIDSMASYLEKLASLHRGKTEDNLLSENGETDKETMSETTESGADGIAQSRIISTRREVVSNNRLVDSITGQSIPSQLPLEGWITQQFAADSIKGKTKHLGIDIAAAEGTIIKAPASGTVVKVLTDQYYGIMLVIRHNDRFVTRYGHCQKVFVSDGQNVEQGQQIALVGNTGYSTAPHLHYEVIKNGNNINPMVLLPSKKK